MVPNPDDVGVLGHVAIVTGSSDGIGLATALLLAARGASIVLNGRDAARLAVAAEQVRSAAAPGARIVQVVGDAGDPSVVEALLAAAAELGGPQIAVANVGGGTVGVTVDDLSEGLLASAVHRNLVPPALLIRAVAAPMRAEGYGRIVTVSSLAGRRYGRVSGPDYSAVKAGVVGLTRHAAAELAPFGVTVNCVAPGLIATGRADSMVESLDPEARARVTESTPMGRPGTPEEVAATIAFLASREASYITGATVDVNGGAFMG